MFATLNPSETVPKQQACKNSADKNSTSPTKLLTTVSVELPIDNNIAVSNIFSASRNDPSDLPTILIKTSSDKLTFSAIQTRFNLVNIASGPTVEKSNI